MVDHFLVEAVACEWRNRRKLECTLCVETKQVE